MDRCPTTSWHEEQATAMEINELTRSKLVNGVLAVSWFHIGNSKKKLLIYISSFFQFQKGCGIFGG